MLQYVLYLLHMEKDKKTREQLLHLLEQKRDPATLSRELHITRQTVHRYLATLMKEGLIEKFGTGPSVYYIKREPSVFAGFMFFTPVGELLEGEEAFTEWSKRHLKRLPYAEKEKLYKERVDALEKKKKDGFFSLTEKLYKLKEVGEALHLSSLKSITLFALEDFGRTRLSYLLESAKKTKGEERCPQIVKETLPEIARYVVQVEADAVAFVPHTVPRKVQLMDEMKRQWVQKYALPVIEVRKISGPEMREQKSIKDIKERIENAEKTFQVMTGPSYEKVVLVDDFAGSGATLNQIAKEIKGIRGAKEVFGITIVGEEKGFSVVKGV